MNICFPFRKYLELEWLDHIGDVQLFFFFFPFLKNTVESKKTSYRLGENICKIYRQCTYAQNIQRALKAQ